MTMPRTAQNKVSPWIEALILSHGLQGEEEGEESHGRLQAHVICVGQMSQSQARFSEGPKGLLVLSDNVVQIPAVLTATAWEKLQEQEDRECFDSLLNATVCIQSFQLQFHMAAEQTRCRFFLSVGELATTCAGPVKDSPPCCTSLASVRTKICRTWRALRGQEESQRSQRAFDLSELLGEWQHDCLQSVLEDVRERLLIGDEQPSTSTYRPPPTRVTTGWDVDRVRYKTEECFSVAVECLLIRDAEQQQTHSPTLSKRPEDPHPSVGGSDCWTPEAAAVERAWDSSEGPLLPEDQEMHEDRIAALNDSPPSNPWDSFPAPGVTSETSGSSPDATPTTETAPAQSRSDPAAAMTSTQITGTKESTFLPPYQKLLITQTAGPSTSTPDEAPPEEELVEQPRKRRLRGVSPETEPLPEPEVGGSPPSWLFITQSGESESECSGGPKQKKLRATPNTHSDGTRFSYSYRATGQNLNDFSRFRVADPVLQWAVKYLLSPTKNHDPPNTDS